MRWFKAILALTLAVMWLPLTAHCQLERLTGLEVLRCAPVQAGETSQDSSCDGGMCCGWESSQYHVPSNQPQAAVPLLAVLAPALAAAEDALPVQVSVALLTAPPPGAPKPWQFSLRAASPVRAPSLVS